MAISRFGNFSEDFATGLFVYGDGSSGQLTIDDGSILTHSVSTSIAETIIGINDGWGTVSMSDGGYRAINTSGAQYVLIGLNDSIASAILRNSALFVQGVSSAGVQVGNGQGSSGRLQVFPGGSVALSSEDFTYFNVGVDWSLTGGGKGVAEFLFGSELFLRAGADADDFLRVDVGASNSGTDGSLSFRDSNWVAETGGEIFVAIGNDGGRGRVSLTGDSQATFTSTASEVSGFVVGSGTGSDGELEMSSQSSLAMTNTGGQVYFEIGRSGGAGKLDVGGNALSFEAASWAGFTVGVTGGTGEMDVDSSAVMEVSSDLGAYFDVGRDGGTGSLVTQDRGVLRLRSDGVEGSLGTVGSGSGDASTGTLGIQSEGLVEILSEGDGVANLTVGLGSAGVGAVDMERTSALSIQSTGAGAAILDVAREGGRGDLKMSDAELKLTSASNNAALRIGLNVDTAEARGVVVMDTHSQTVIEGDNAFVTVSQHSDTVGILEVLGGSTVELKLAAQATGDTYFGVGYRNETSGIATISGLGSRVFGVMMTEVGLDPLDRSEIIGRDLTGAGNGSLLLEDQGRLESELLVVGRGGRLTLSEAHVETTLTEVRGGAVIVDGDGTSTLQGDLDVTTGSLFFSDIVVADVPETAMLLHSGGSIDLGAETSIGIATRGGQRFFGGERITLIETQSGALHVDADVSMPYIFGSFAFGTFLEDDGSTARLNLAVFGDRTTVYLADLTELGMHGVTVRYQAEAGRARVTQGEAQVYLTNAQNLRTTDGDDLIQFSDTSAYFSVWAGAGDDVMISGREHETFHGEAGRDTVEYVNATGAVQVYLNAGRAIGPEDYDKLFGIEDAVGSDFDDRLVGDGSANLLTGGLGNDILKGKGGLDSLRGGAGDDRIWGGAVVDIIEGGVGDDILFGLSGEDRLEGAGGRDYLYGGRGNDILLGGDGDDVLRGNLNNDDMQGGAGFDDLRGGGSNDALEGGADDDFLFGDKGKDRLHGGAGDDTLVGGESGAAGGDGFADVFVYGPVGAGSGGFDRIKDMEDGIDRIDLSGFGFADFASVTALASDRASGMRLDLGIGDVLFVEGFQMAQFDAGDVILS